MAAITKLKVDVENEKLIVSATSTGITHDTSTGKTLHHKFVKLYIDNVSTFNCSSEPSTSATSIALTLDYDQDLENFEIPFSSILCDDVSQELIFVWIEEDEYTETTTYSGFVVDSALTNELTVYLTNGTKYFRASYEDNIIGTFEEVSESIFESERESAIGDYVVQCFTDTLGLLNFLIQEDESEIYYILNITNLTTSEITKSAYYDACYKIFNMSYYFGVTLSVRTLYELILAKIKIVDSSCCKADCSDVNFMLAWQGFNLAKALAKYKQMIYYWKILHRSPVSTSSGCGCA